MHLHSRPPIRPPRAEALERRWLLSADLDSDDLLSQLRAMVLPGSAIEVVEAEYAGEDDDSDIPIDPSELPEEVLAALQARIPGAVILDAAETEEDGELEFDLKVSDGGRTLELTVSEDGEVLETEETPGEIPDELIDWVKTNFPNARIDEAVLVTEDEDDLSYELSIENGQGPAIEARLRIVQTTTPDPVDDTTENTEIAVAPDPAPANDTTNVTPNMTTDPETAGVAPAEPVAAATSTETGSAAEDESAAAAQAQGQNEDVPEALLAPAADQQADAFANSMNAILASTGAAPWLPGVAGLLNDVFTLDVAKLELELEQVLHQIDLLTRQISSGAGRTDASAQVALLSALVAAALLLLDARRGRDEASLTFSAADSSWSWVVGTSDPKSHRHRKTSR